jgi:glycosyltransferase involved in cell wall biosynthesis
VRFLNLLHQAPPAFVGGTELYTEALSKALAARGDSVAVFARAFGAPGLQRARREGVDWFLASEGPLSATRRFVDGFRAPGLFATWQHTLESWRPDLVLVQHLMGLPMACIESLLERRIPYVVMLHDYWWVCANANLLTNHSLQPCDGPRAYLNCTRCAVARAGDGAAWLAAPAAAGALAWRGDRLRRLLQGAHLRVAPSAFVADWHQRHVTTGPVHTARLGITPPPEGIPAHTARPQGGPLRLAYVGGLAPNKGLHVALQALQGVRGDWQLQVVGDTTQDPAYVASLQQLAGPQVHFRGRLGRQDVWQALAQSDILLIPSLWHETFCLAAHEGAAAGAVPFAAQMGALAELVCDGVNGRLLPAGDVMSWRRALQAAVDDPAAVAQMRERLPPPRLFGDHVAELLALLDGAPALQTSARGKA